MTDVTPEHRQLCRTCRSRGCGALPSEKLRHEIHLEPGRQGHRHPVCGHGDRDRFGGIGAVVDDAAATGVPGHLLLHLARGLPPAYHDARHDHGHLPAHGAVSGRVWQLPHPADGRRPRHGVPLCEHAELLGLSAGRAGAGGEFLCAGRVHRCGLDALPAAGHPRRHAGTELRHYSDARLAGPVHHRVHHGRLELRGDGVAGAHARHDADASALDRMGHFRCHHSGAAGLPRPVRRRGDDDV